MILMFFLKLWIIFRKLSSAKVNWRKSEALAVGEGPWTNWLYLEALCGLKYLGVYLGDETFSFKNNSIQSKELYLSLFILSWTHVLFPTSFGVSLWNRSRVTRSGSSNGTTSVHDRQVDLYLGLASTYYPSQPTPFLILSVNMTCF